MIKRLTHLVVGTVADAAGTVIPGTNVTFAHFATGTEYSTQSNESGRYRSFPLSIGGYILVAEAEGFKQYSGSGAALSIGNIRQLAIAEIIEVDASATLLQTTEASAGTVIENRQIANPPLPSACLISAGLAPSRCQGVLTGGKRGFEAGFMMYGIDNNQLVASQGRQKEVVQPNVDAISEFKMITNGFSAEFGRSSAGIISLAIKSSTNDLHGTGVYFARDEKLDVQHCFSNPAAEEPESGREQDELGNGNFGIVSGAGRPRNPQIGLKFIF